MLRDAHPADVAAMTGVAIDSGLFPDEEHAFLVEMFVEVVGRDRGVRAGRLCVVDDNRGRLVAVAYAQAEAATDRTWDLTLLAVLTAAQGTGVGGSLLAEVERRLTQAAQRLLLVRTSGLPAFDGARGFYLNTGYEEEARIRDRWADGDDDITFSKRLQPVSR